MSILGRTASTALLLGLVAAAPATAQPANDAFAGAIPLVGDSGSTAGSNVDATKETGEPSHAPGTTGNKSVWWTWTPTAPGAIEVSTAGSGFDTVLAAYTGADVGSLTLASGNDDRGGPQSFISIRVQPGLVYRIAVDGKTPADSGPITLGWQRLSFFGDFMRTAVLPYARSVPLGSPATAFAAMINTTTGVQRNCRPNLPDGFPAAFAFQTTDSANALTGTPNAAVDIPAGGTQNFVFAITPTRPIAIEVTPYFTCTTAIDAAIVTGLNTFILSADVGAAPDLVAIGATPSADGIVTITGPTGTGVFAAAAVNIGPAGTVTARADDGGRGLPLTLLLCQTDPATGLCTNPAVPAPEATLSIGAGATATFTVFVQGGGDIAFDPAVNRLFLRLETADGVTRGATTVAVRTDGGTVAAAGQ